MNSRSSVTGTVTYAPRMKQIFETVWGKGFLSQGGTDEVACMLAGIELRGREIIDVGCGTGGYTIDLLESYGPARIVGIDTEEALLDDARHLAKQSGITRDLQFQLAKPGKLPFADASFDVVFCKEVLFHINDKPSFYNDVFRILRPCGAFVASHWFDASNNEPSAQMLAWQKSVGGKMLLHTQRESEHALFDAGFERSEIKSRRIWSLAETRKDLARQKDEQRARLLELVGEVAYLDILEKVGLRIKALESGQLEPCHIRAWKSC